MCYPYLCLIPDWSFFIRNSTSPGLSRTTSTTCFKTFPKINPIRCVHSLQAFMLTTTHPRNIHQHNKQGVFRHQTSPTGSHSMPAKLFLEFTWLMYPVSLHGRHYLTLYQHLWSNLATEEETWTADFCLSLPTAFLVVISETEDNASSYTLQISLTWTLKRNSTILHG